MIFSRVQAIAAADTARNTFSQVTAEMDRINSLFENVDIDEQHFCDIETHHERSILTAETVNYLVASSYDLTREKNIVLKEPRSPIEITITEYGTLGENDENLTFFNRSNNLSDVDLLLLPAGREVSVYV